MLRDYFPFLKGGVPVFSFEVRLVEVIMCCHLVLSLQGAFRDFPAAFRNSPKASWQSRPLSVCTCSAFTGRHRRPNKCQRGWPGHWDRDDSATIQSQQNREVNGLIQFSWQIAAAGPSPFLPNKPW